VTAYGYAATALIIAGIMLPRGRAGDLVLLAGLLIFLAGDIATRHWGGMAFVAVVIAGWAWLYWRRRQSCS
jgi:hypothetical protein